jgi:phage-related protein
MDPVRREIQAFDGETIRSELNALPKKDRSKLSALIEYLEECPRENPHPVQIDAYENGVLRIRHIKAAYQGRALCYIAESREGFQKFVLLLVYKKESDRVPPAMLETAKRRMDRHRKGKP